MNRGHDYDAAVKALELAVQSSPKDFVDDELVERAEAFYAFLTGEEAKS